MINLALCNYLEQESNDSEQLQLDFYNMEVKGDELQYRRSIELQFGGPWTRRQEERVEKWALEWGLSIEQVIDWDFKQMISGFNSPKHVQDRNYFDLCAFVVTEIHGVYVPKVKAGYYFHKGTKYPSVIFKNGFLLDKDRVSCFFFKDEHVDGMGNLLEEYLEYEYLGFKRI